MQHQKGSLFLIGNIPGHYHSYHLRTFFSDFIEKRGFLCFHFKHRPEYERESTIQELRENSTASTSNVSTKTESSSINAPGGSHSSTLSDVRSNAKELKKSRTFCCVVVVDDDLKQEFVRSYSCKNWIGENDTVLPQKVRLVPLTRKDTCTEFPLYYSQLEKEDLTSLSELNPPRLMPQGNVGTPISVFLDFIKSCRLPSHVIKKLRLNFPIGKKSKKYSAVPMTYASTTGDEGIAYSEIKGERDQNRPQRKKETEESENHGEDERIPSVCVGLHIYICGRCTECCMISIGNSFMSL